MSKRRRNRPSGPKHAQPETSSTIPHKNRVNGETPSVAATGMQFSGPSPMAYSGELLPPAPLPEPSTAIPCDATQKSVMFERGPMGSLMTELEPLQHDDVAAGARERADMDSFPPLVSSEYEEQRDVYPPSVIARRKRARKLVGVVIGAAALFFAFGVGKTALASRGTTVSAALSQSKVEVSRAQERLGASIGSLVQSMSDIIKQAPLTAAVAPVPVAAPAEPAGAATDAAQGAKLRKEAESLLNRGRFKDAIEVSRAAIAADPSEATSYLMLGTALQSTGKWKDGIEAYSQCVRNAKRGPVHECQAVGGRK